jgi:hypothetical protein
VQERGHRFSLESITQSAAIGFKIGTDPGGSEPRFVAGGGAIHSCRTCSRRLGAKPAVEPKPTSTTGLIRAE